MRTHASSGPCSAGNETKQLADTVLQCILGTGEWKREESALRTSDPSLQNVYGWVLTEALIGRKAARCETSFTVF
jgi:hypothetical protein